MSQRVCVYRESRELRMSAYKRIHCAARYSKHLIPITHSYEATPYILRNRLLAQSINIRFVYTVLREKSLADKSLSPKNQSLQALLNDIFFVVYEEKASHLSYLRLF